VSCLLKCVTQICKKNPSAVTTTHKTAALPFLQSSRLVKHCSIWLTDYHFNGWANEYACLELHAENELWIRNLSHCPLGWLAVVFAVAPTLLPKYSTCQSLLYTSGRVVAHDVHQACVTNPRNMTWEEKIAAETMRQHDSSCGWWCRVSASIYTTHDG